MTGPRILVVGAGSIGSRHAANLAKLGASVSVTDPDPQRSRAVGLPVVPSGATDDYAGFDGVVVASPTTHHLRHALAALDGGARVLVEKPLAASSDGIDQVVRGAGDRLTVGYNLRFHEPVRRVIERVHAGAIGRVLSVRLWFGSWLPDWRPGTDYRASYSARADLGGGVLLDAIHELDLLVWLAGDARFAVAGAVVARVGPLDIDVEDTVRAVLRHADGAVAEVSLDYLSRRYRRGMEVVGDDATIRYDWSRRVLELEDATGVRSESFETPVARSYELEAEHFLSFVAGRAGPAVDVRTAASTVRLAEAIRRSARRNVTA